MCPHGRAHLHHLANTIESFICGGNAVLCQITLTTCYYYAASQYYVRKCELLLPTEYWCTDYSPEDNSPVIMIALCNTADHYIFGLWFLSIFFFFYSSPNLSKKVAKNRHLGTIAQLVFASKARIDSRKTFKHNISSTRSHNMVNFGPLTADIGSGVWGTPENFNGFRVLASLLQRRHSPEANQTLHDLWSSPWLVHHIYIFGGSCPWRNFATCKIHFAYKSCVFLYWHRYCMALQQWDQPKFVAWYKERNYRTVAEAPAPPIFGWAAITLGIGPHSSYYYYDR